MLPRANRVTRPADFRAALRRGRRIVSPNTVMHVLEQRAEGPSRFGFVVSKSVGNAVTRNLVKRRLRSAGADAVRSRPVGVDVVVRALPASAEAAWVTLHREITEGVIMDKAEE